MASQIEQRALTHAALKANQAIADEIEATIRSQAGVGGAGGIDLLDEEPVLDEYLTPRVQLTGCTVIPREARRSTASALRATSVGQMSGQKE